MSINMLCMFTLHNVICQVYFKKRNVIRGWEGGSRKVDLHLLWHGVRNKLSVTFFKEVFGLDLGKVSG